ncbi:MAG: GrrA/OscA1 family cyclophane-containing rSAM-modified RiPP [Synechococcus sp. ArSW.bin.68]
MNKTTLLSIAAILASSSVLIDASHSAVLSEPDPGNALEQRIEKLSSDAWARLGASSDRHDGQTIARAWGNGNGRAFGNGGGRGRAFGNGGGGGFANGYRAGFANW